ncbi:MAG TPA: hypothetical protein VIJ70_08570 [Gaiellaceae bacterium]
MSQQLAVASPSMVARRRNNQRHPGRIAACAAALCATALAVPGVASAHGRAATVALDYRLPVDPAVARITGITASILDGDRDLQLTVADGVRVVVLGDLGEPMLRMDDGVWVNRASPTAQANRLIRKPGSGWKQLSHGRSLAWHEHRLAPPPFVGGSYGHVADWQIPLTVNGQRTAISGTFVRVPRPTIWPWLAAAALAVAAAGIALRLRPQLRSPVTVIAGVVAGVAGLTTQTALSLRDAPSGNIAWALVGAGFAIGAIAAWAIAVSRGPRRAYVAGAIGIGVAAFCLSWVGVFFHGVVISALSANTTRVTCALAFTFGLVALIGAVSVDPPDEDVA